MTSKDYVVLDNLFATIYKDSISMFRQRQDRLPDLVMATVSLLLVVAVGMPWVVNAREASRAASC